MTAENIPVPTIVESDYRKNRREKHEEMNTPTELIKELVLKATGSRSVQEEWISEAGEVNDVYNVTLESGEEIIARMFLGRNIKFYKEQWAFEQCKEAGVSVPQTLLVESLNRDERDWEISLESKIPGQSLAKKYKNGFLDELTPEAEKDLIDLLHQAGQMLFKIHSVHPNGFGTLDGNGKGEASSVTEYILNSGYFRRDLVLPKLNDRPDDQALVLHVYEILEKEAANYSPVSPSLVHNDYSPEHVFVDEGEVSGIIDMENSCGLAPIFDLARWDSKFGAKFPLKYLIEGYGDQELFKGDFERELNYWKMFNHIKSLRYNLDKSNQAGIDKCLNGLRELMPQFE